MSSNNNQHATILGSVVVIAISMIVAVVMNHSRQSRKRAPRDGTATTDDEGNSEETTNTTEKKVNSISTPTASTATTAVPDTFDQTHNINTSSTEIDSLFELAANQVRSTTNNNSLKDGQKLFFYGLYKQATEGDAPPTTPLWNPVARLKHEAWTKFQGKSSNAAKELYVAFASMWIGNGSRTTTLQRPMEQMDGEIHNTGATGLDADDDADDDDVDVFGNGMGIRPSMPTTEDDDGDSDNEDSSTLASNHRPLHAAARDGDGTQLQRLIKSHYSHKHNTATTTLDHLYNINDCDKTGQTALHLAADHGHDECVQLLLQAGADPNAADFDGISVLQTAVIADHVSTAALLLEAGANPDQPDADGDTPRSCCASSTQEMQQLFASRL